MRSVVRVAVAALLLMVPACGDDGVDPDPPEPQDFTGTYTIVSFAQGAAGVPVPGASGTVVLTATTYTFSVTVPPLTLTDEGVYEANGTATSGTWEQQSTIDPNVQATGTYAVDTATNQLTLDTTVQGIRNLIVLRKT